MITISYLPLKGQYFQFSQYEFTEQRVNPAFVATSDYAKLDLIYRNQSASEDFIIKSTGISASYPLIGRNGGKRWAGIGVSFLEDRSGEAGIFKINEFAITYALNFTLSKTSSLALGFKTLHQSRSISLDGLYTGSQYIPGRGFDISKSPGESINEFNHNFLTFSTGLQWQTLDNKGQPAFYAGFSFFDFNKPTDSFLSNNSELPLTNILNVGFKIYNNRNVSIYPDLLITNVSSETAINVGAVTSYELYSRYASGGKINFISRYVIGKYFIAGIQMEKEKFKFGFSFDIPASQQIANNGTVEFAFEFRNLIKSKYRYKSTKGKKTRNKKNKIKKSRKEKPNVKNRNEKSDAKSILQTPNIVDSLNVTVHQSTDSLPAENIPKNAGTSPQYKDSLETTATAGKLERMPLELEKTQLTFNFRFESTEIDEESAVYLKDLTQILHQDPHLKIKITGHTDSSGSEKFNIALSKKRAEGIKQILIKNGIAESRITIKAEGESQPIYNNETPEGRAGNRRVEFVMYY